MMTSLTSSNGLLERKGHSQATATTNSNGQSNGQYHKQSALPTTKNGSDNKYQKSQRYRRKSKRTTLAPSWLFRDKRVILGALCLVLVSFVGYFGHFFSRHDSQETQQAWADFERAKKLVRRRGQRLNPDWPEPLGSSSRNKNKNNDDVHTKRQHVDAKRQRRKVDFGRRQPARDDESQDKSEDENNDHTTPIVPAKSVAEMQRMSDHELVNLFDSVRPADTRQMLTQPQREVLAPLLKEWSRRLDRDLMDNRAGGIRWIRPYLLPPLHEGQRELVATPNHQHGDEPKSLFKVRRGHEFKSQAMWRQEWQQYLDELKQKEQDGLIEDVDEALRPRVDYTDPSLYTYPPLMESPPEEGGYPVMKTLGELIHDWPQNQDKQGDIHESLLHFNYSNPKERAMAERFRDARLPFKVYDIPDITRVTELWKDDDYIHQQFDQGGGSSHLFGKSPYKRASGLAQESPNHFFAFFVEPFWQTATMGLPPVRNNDISYQEWSQHASYADAVHLKEDQPHFYWQSGADRQERFNSPDKQSFISRDLNTTLGATNDNFFVFHVEEQKGIQCRFGERGVTAATHFDAGQNMIAMLRGAKRYILSPPRACPHLGVFSVRHSPIFRHSLLNFAHLEYLDDNNSNNNHTDQAGQTMSEPERAWLERASQAPALETVLKAGEVLFLPSFWFHYITSLQKSAQCNVRSGIDEVGTKEHGNVEDINVCGTIPPEKALY